MIKKPEPEKYALRKESGDKYKLSELQTISNKNKNKNMRLDRSHAGDKLPMPIIIYCVDTD